MQQNNNYHLYLKMTLIQMACICFFLSCNPTATNIDSVKELETASKPDHHNSKLSLDWEGTYIGILPCADCEGIETSITLKTDLSYQSKRKYLGKKDSVQVFEQSGNFQWNTDGGQIVIVDKMDTQRYLVGEGRLFHLDKKGIRIQGDLAEKYLLIKQ